MELTKGVSGLFIILVFLSPAQSDDDEEETIKTLSDRVDASQQNVFTKLKDLKENQDGTLRSIRQELEELRSLIMETAVDYEGLVFDELGAYEELPPTANLTLSLHNIWTADGRPLGGRVNGDQNVKIYYNPNLLMDPDCLNLKGLAPNRHVRVYVNHSCIRLFVDKNCAGAYATMTHPRVLKPYSFPWRSIGPCKFVHF